MNITDKQLCILRRAQQGEIDAVLMYNALAKVVPASDAETFRQLAKEEGHHANVFHRYTQLPLKAGHLKERVVPFIYRVLGRKITYTLIAQAEYRADGGYQSLIADFPEVASVAADETRHGDMVSGLLKKEII